MPSISIFLILATTNAVQAAQHWLEDGCSRVDVQGRQKGKWANDDDAIGEVQCCNDRNICSRAKGVCFSSVFAPDCKTGTDHKSCNLKTYPEAVAICAAVSMRLCTKEETLHPREHDCCQKGCYLDEALVWTSTPSITTTSTATTTTATVTTTTKTTTTTNTIVAAIQDDLSNVETLLESQILKTEEHVQMLQGQISDLLKQFAERGKADQVRIAELEAMVALKLDKPTPQPAVGPLPTACAKESDCSPTVDAAGDGTVLGMNSCCGSVVINSAECTVNPCDLLNDLNVVKDAIGL